MQLIKRHLLHSKVRQFIAIFTMVMIVLAVYFFGYINRLQHEKPKIVGSVTIGIANGEYSSSFFIAEKLGYFTDNGLHVKLRTYVSGVDAYNAMLKGDVSVSGQADYVLLDSILKRKKVHIFSTYMKINHLTLIGRKDLGILKVSDLKGKKVGLPKNTIWEYYLGRYLELHGMSIDDVDLVDVYYTKSQEAIKNGLVDAIVTFPPYYHSIKSSMNTNIIEWSIQGDQKAYIVLASKDEWLTENSHLAVRLLKALDQANAYIDQHSDESLSIVQKRLTLDSEVIKGIWQRNTFSLSLDQQLILNMEDEFRWMSENKLLNTEEMPDFVNYINIEILKKVKPENMTIIY